MGLAHHVLPAGCVRRRLHDHGGRLSTTREVADWNRGAGTHVNPARKTVGSAAGFLAGSGRSCSVRAERFRGPRGRHGGNLARYASITPVVTAPTVSGSASYHARRTACVRWPGQSSTVVTGRRVAWPWPSRVSNRSSCPGRARVEGDSAGIGVRGRASAGMLAKQPLKSRRRPRAARRPAEMAVFLPVVYRKDANGASERTHARSRSETAHD
jgi:hypothetical protein